jgi:hypothetical protein
MSAINLSEIMNFIRKFLLGYIEESSGKNSGCYLMCAIMCFVNFKGISQFAAKKCLSSFQIEWLAFISILIVRL